MAPIPSPFRWSAGIIPITGIPAQPGHVFDDAGTYDATVQLFPTLAPTCADVAVVPVTVLTPPVADFTLPADTCAASVQPDGRLHQCHRLQLVLAGQGVISTDAVPDPVDLVGPGKFTFSLEVTSANGCTDTKAGPWRWRACPMPISPWQMPASGCPRSWTDRVPPPTPPLGATSSHGVGPSMTGPCSPVPTRR